MSKQIRVWDLPLRFFHWALVVSVVVALASGLKGNMGLHQQAGLAVVTLLSFRLAWLFLGSTYARIGALLGALPRIPDYLRGNWRKPGHNPLGVLSMGAMLLVLGWQSVSGLFTNDDSVFTGPLYRLIDKADSLMLTGLHRQTFWLLVGLIALHVATVLFYWLVKKNNLVKPMITGNTEQLNEEYKPATGGRWLAFVLSCLFAVGAFYVAQGSWVPKPPPPAPASALPF
ncbi:cytochrome b/b6 domain-containing protein [Thiopseudomonas denitrificans]|uniref:Cytochrome b n=1 Tax=Thiopseudomonas denitrificans TaxID=1501432 RepID=A0A4R6TTN7_9GAMM|nr:cytochrome b/b6 domain-containing protein [Thiopseudomonas denitrificans]TDQ37048.1 cytochrome b [Thiopseudomonas denitrificans]